MHEKHKLKVKVIPQQAEVAQDFPGRLRPRIFLTFGTTRVVDRQPYAPAAFNPGEIPGTHFQGLNRAQGTWFRRGEPQKKSPVTSPGIYPETVRPVAQCLNHYATPGPACNTYHNIGLVWAGTRAQYGSGMLHHGQVLRVSLPLFSPIRGFETCRRHQKLKYEHRKDEFFGSHFINIWLMYSVYTWGSTSDNIVCWCVNLSLKCPKVLSYYHQQMHLFITHIKC
jgi:hypothetical protein